MNNSQNREKLWALMKDVRFCMISHVTETNELHSQPMTMLNSERMNESQNLYFLLKDNSAIAHAISAGRNKIGLSFAKPSDSTYVSISAHAQISRDQSLINELWNPWADNWFDGKEDPTVRVLIAEAVSAEYWNIKDNKVTQLFKMLKGSVTGEAGLDSDHEKLEL